MQLLELAEESNPPIILESKGEDIFQKLNGGTPYVSSD